jgi:hypothetical protein
MPPLKLLVIAKSIISGSFLFNLGEHVRFNYHWTDIISPYFAR